MLPYIVGVAGGTGSGKTTVARKIAEALPSEMVSILEHDSYYVDRGDLTYDERCLLNFDHPESLETPLLVTHVKKLRGGEAVEVPMYDFKAHRRAPTTRRIEPTPIVVVEGILLFSDAPLRETLDLKIFVDTDADVRVLRRVRRDMEKRGRSFESVRDQYYKTVRPMHLQFVEPSKRWADVILPEGGDNSVGLDLIVSKVRSVLAARG
jgi:uridine kinase